MNEEHLADLLTEHLDAFLADQPLPEILSDEVAGLLVVAQSLAEIAPAPRLEFGPALRVSLLGPAGGGNGATPAAGSTFSSSTLFILIIGLLVTIAGLALVASLTIFVTARSNPTQTLTAPNFTSPAGSPSPTTPPIQTQPAQSPPLFQTPSFSPPTTLAITSTPVASPTLTVTPIVDVLPAVTITIEIRIEPPHLVPGPSGGSGGGNGNGGGNGGGSSGGSGGGSSGGGGDNDDDDGGGGEDDDD